MRSVQTTFFIIIAGFTIVSIHCDRAPTEKVNAAKRALSKAESEEAAIYAEKEFACAQELFSESFNELDLMKEKQYFFYFRKYADVNRKLDSVILLAQEAADIAKTTKEWLKPEIHKP